MKRVLILNVYSQLSSVQDKYVRGNSEEVE
jgi:hypothetical protein